MTLHKEGTPSILLAVVLLVITGSMAELMLNQFLFFRLLFWAIGIFFFIVMLQFFRKPNRSLKPEANKIFAPADGKVVVIEQTYESEYLKEDRIQLSIFMSPINVHINWFPISGMVKYFKHHHGKYLVAWDPKASTDNERTTVVVEGENNFTILIRQIAGALARRIVCYAEVGSTAEQGSELGFIKFGSRVDVFLPLGTEILVQLDEEIKGNRTVIAELPV